MFLKDLILRNYILFFLIYPPIWQPRSGCMAPLSGIALICWEIINIEGGRTNNRFSEIETFEIYRHQNSTANSFYFEFSFKNLSSSRKIMKI